MVGHWCSCGSFSSFLVEEAHEKNDTALTLIYKPLSDVKTEAQYNHNQ